MTSAGARRPAVMFIFVTLLLDVLGFGLLIPVAPKLVQGLLNGGAGGTEQQAAPFVAGLMATYAFMQFVFAPVLGALSDRFGRRRVLLISLLGSALDYFAMALAPSLAWLFVTRVINGISGASMTVCNAYIADVTPPEKRAAAFGLIGAAFGIGFVIGPLMGGVLGDIHLHLPFYVAGALTLFNWFYGLLVLPESLAPDKRSKRWELSRLNPVGALAALGRYPVVLGLAGALFLLNLAMFGLHATWVLYTGLRYGWDAKAVGLSLAVVGIGAAIVQGGLARRIIPALGERASLLIGLLIGSAAYAAYGLATHGWMIYIIIAFASIGGIAGPAGQSLITRSVRADEQGAVQGALTSLQSLAQIGGPLIAGAVFAWFTREGARPYLPGASFLLGALLALAGTVVAWWVTRPRAQGPA